MDKKEACKFWVKVNNECVNLNSCEECPGYITELNSCIWTHIGSLRVEKFITDFLAEEGHENSTSPHDNVNSPKHYCKGGLECIQVIKAQLTPEQNKGYLYGNVLKYMWRWQDKNGLEDLRKAEHYLKWLIEEVQNNG